MYREWHWGKHFSYLMYFLVVFDVGNGVGESTLLFDVFPYL